MQGLISWLSAHGGIFAVVLGLVVFLNSALSALSSFLTAVHLNVPGWVGSLAAALKKVVDFISANQPHP